MNRRLFITLAAGIAPLAIAADAPWKTGKGWKPLLNGRDLTGWRGADTESVKGQNEWITARSVRIDSAVAKTLTYEAGPGGIILNSPKGKTVNLVTAEAFGDCELYAEFLLTPGSNSGIYLQGLYEIQIFDSFNAKELKTSDCGAIYHRWIDGKPVGGSVPRVNASLPPGQWQSIHAWFQAPDFHANGKKADNAKFLKVLLNGKVVQENVTVDGGTRSHMPIPEGAKNPLMLQGDHGPVAFRNIYIRPTA
jgi:hypothetical protein